MAETRLPDGRRDDGHLQLHARQRPDLELRGQQLAAWARTRPPSTCSPGTPTAPGCRPNMHSFYLRSLLPGEPARPRARWSSPAKRSTSTIDPTATCTSSARAGPHRAVGGQLPTTPGCSRTRDVRFVLSSGPHRRHRQPAEPEGVVPDRPSATPPDPKDWFEASDQPRGILVGGLGRAGSRPRAGERVSRPAMGSRKHRPVGDAPGNATCSSQVRRVLAEVRIAYYSAQQISGTPLLRRHAMPSPAIEYTQTAQDKTLNALRRARPPSSTSSTRGPRPSRTPSQDLPAIPVAELAADARGDHQVQLRLRGQGARRPSASSPRSS